MRRSGITFLLLFLLFPTGCNYARQSESRGAATRAVQEAIEGAPPAAPVRDIAAERAKIGATANTQKVGLQQAGSGRVPALAAERKIIRQAEITLELDAPTEGQRRIAAIAEEMGGYVVTSDVRRYHGDPAANQESSTVTLTLRVPQSQFGSAVERIRGVGKRVLGEKTSGQDVTEEYIDLEARLRSKMALEAQFLEIMKGAKTIAEALEVQRQVSEVRTEIEQLEGRRRFLENQSGMSTITVTLQPPQPIITSTGFGLVSSLKHAFGDSIDLTISIITGLIRLLGVLLPLLLLVIVPCILLLRFFLKRFRRRNHPPA